jgi:hypothetical protein
MAQRKHRQEKLPHGRRKYEPKHWAAKMKTCVQTEQKQEPAPSQQKANGTWLKNGTAAENEAGNSGFSPSDRARSQREGRKIQSRSSMEPRQRLATEIWRNEALQRLEKPRQKQKSARDLETEAAQEKNLYTTIRTAKTKLLDGTKTATKKHSDVRRAHEGKWTTHSNSKTDFFIAIQTSLQSIGHRPSSLIWLKTKNVFLIHFYTRNVKIKLKSGNEPQPSTVIYIYMLNQKATRLLCP